MKLHNEELYNEYLSLSRPILMMIKQKRMVSA